MDNRILTHRYFLTAGECDGNARMPLPLLVSRLIEVATEHANSLGIGYDRLITLNLAWVLSRVSVEISRLPGINESYSVATWIESTNRLFSERCFTLSDASGKPFAHARTTWAAIDITLRKPTNPGVLGDIMFPTDPLPCPVAPAPRMKPLPDSARAETYTFRYCDLDFNRHVNTVRYVDLILNHWPLDWHDTHSVARFDITFIRESHFGETADLRVADDGPQSLCELLIAGDRRLTAAITWRPRN